MQNVLIVGATLPQTLADPDGGNPQTRLGGCAPTMAQVLMAGQELRTTLLTALQRDDLGKATIRLLEQSGLLYRAVNCNIPTVHQVDRRRPGSEPSPGEAEIPTLTRAVMHAPISQTAPDYDYVVTDCNLDHETLFELGRIAQKLVINGTSEARCIRILASNPWPKAAVKVNREQAVALMAFTEARNEKQLKDAVKTERLLITKDREGWTLHSRQETIHGPPVPAQGHSNYTGAGDAALAALVQAMVKSPNDPAEAITKAIAARLAQNPA